MARRMDFTTGNVAKQLLAFSVPIFLANLLQTSYQFIDSLWVGNLLGRDALAALSISSPVIFATLSFIIGINNATLTVLSQKKGAGDEEGLRVVLNDFAFVLGVMAVASGVLGFVFSRPLLALLGAPEAVMPLSLLYLKINFTGILFLFGYNFIGTVLRALGDSRTPVHFVFLAVVLNAFAAPFFIRIMGLGIAGAGLATVAAQGIAFLYGLIYSIKKAGVPFEVPRPPRLDNFKLLMKLGVPSGLQMLAISGGSAAITSVAARFGEDVLAGYGASERINNLIMIPIQTLGIAMTSMAGQNMGLRRLDRVAQIARYGLLYNFIVSLAIGVFVYLFAPVLICLFIRDEAATDFGVAYLKGVAPFYVFLGVNFVLNGVVRAAGAMLQILVLNLISFWILRFPLSYLFGAFFGPIGIAYGIGTSFVISSGCAVGYYIWGRWRNLRLFEETKAR